MSSTRTRQLPLPAAVGVYVLCAVTAAAVVVGNVYANKYSGLISVYLGQRTQEVVSVDGTEAEADYYTSSFASEDERQAYLEQVGERISEGGITLLKNEGAALPLAQGAKISVFGQSAVDPVYGGGGAGSVDTDAAVSLHDSFTAAGFELNSTLWDFYETGEGKDYRRSTPDVYGVGSFEVNEVPQSVYTAEVKASYAEYADAAVVVVGRSGGESADLSTTADATGVTYLQLSQDEKDLLSAVQGEFETVVVLLNTQNAMELGWLDEYDVDAALWVGSFGQTGATAVGEVLTGAVNPSGSLVDTYAYDSLSAPSAANFGNATIANSTVEYGTSYMVYAEGVYVGYRYYETRYEDVVTGVTDAASYDYTQQVQFPFGYGGSYTTFSWDGYTVVEQDDVYAVSVTVTNTGAVAGRDVVQVYLQQPYTDYDREHGVEKPSVELAGYAKTDQIEAGDRTTVTVEVPKELFKVYDDEGAGTYVVDAGDYYIAAGHDAHDALNNVLAAKGATTDDGMDAPGDATFTHRVTVATLDTTTYATSAETGSQVSNQFTDADIATYDDSFTYLSRSDWTGTWPTAYADGSWTAPQEVLDALAVSSTEEADATAPVQGTVDAENGELTAATLIGVDLDNETWSALMGQATVDELDQLVRVGGYATAKVDSIQLPGTTVKDGPAGISSTLVGGENGMGYAPAVVLASTWDDALAQEFGAAVGEDSLALGVSGWYAPAVNLHRSPYGGRNFEYFSEDPVLSGQMAAEVVDGAQSKGVMVFVKHFALNDQETNRMGGAMFADEQTVRQLYLRPFELTVREGGARGIMVSMNRIGTRWTGGDYGLVTTTLREEWGFAGTVVTDQASYSVFAYEDLREGLEAGTDLWLNTDASLWQLSDEQLTPSVLSDLRRAATNVAYTVVNSNAMNGLTADSRIVSVTPAWRWWLIGLDVALGGLVLGGAGLVTRSLLRRRRDGAAAPVTGSPPAGA